MFEKIRQFVNKITLSQYTLLIAFAVIVIIACIISPLSNFIDTKIDNLAGIAWITKADKGPDLKPHNATEKIYKLDCW